MHRLRYLIGFATLLATIAGAFWIVRVLHSVDEGPGMPLRIEFRDARGLRAGADVRLRGVRVGTVRGVSIAGDGTKAVAWLMLDPDGARHARVDSEFWIVTPRLHGLVGGASGLDTLVRDSYVAFHTPGGDGSPLVGGSLLAGRERPPATADPEALEEMRHGDLLMTLLVPENHGLRAGSPVVFRGVQTGDVRSVALVAEGTHLEVTLRIARAHRQTVTDKSRFWIARPQVSGALFSGIEVTDVEALLSPHVAYYGEPGKGLPVQDGFRAAALASRPDVDAAAVPREALRPVESAPSVPDGVHVVRIAYAAIERDTWSADDQIERQGSGLLLRDRDGRAVVATARSLVDASFTERDAFGGDPDVDDERLTVMLADGTVLRAGRIWVDGEGRDLAVLLLDGAPPDLSGTAVSRLQFEPSVPAANGAAGEPAAGVHDGSAAPGENAGSAELLVRRASADGGPLPPVPLTEATDVTAHLGGAVSAGERVVGVWGRRGARSRDGVVVPLSLLPADLRPR
jgi:hypothetical protein